MKKIFHALFLLMPLFGLAQTPGTKVDAFPRWNDINRNATRQNPWDNIAGEIYRYSPCGEDAIAVYDPCTLGVLQEIANNTSDSTVTVLKQVMCDSGVPFLRYSLVITDAALNVSLQPVGDYDANGNTYTPIATVTLGDCQQKTVITTKNLCNPSLAASGFVAGPQGDLTFGANWQIARGGSVTLYDFNGYVPAVNANGVSNFAPPNPFQITFRDADTAPTPTGWVQRTFDIENPCSQGTASTGSTGIDDGNGSPSNKNAFLFDFTAFGGTPINAFGIDGVDLESDAAFTVAEIRAYGATQNLLATYPIIYPSGSNGNDKIHFIGFERALADVYYVAVVVGDDNGNALAEQIAFDNLRVGVSDLALTSSNVELVVFSDGTTKCYSNLGVEIPCAGAEECPDFTTPPTIDFEYIKLAFCSNGDNYIAVQQYADSTLIATTWLDATLAVVPPPTPRSLGFCVNTTDFETTTTTVCANNIAYQRIDYFENGLFIAAEYKLGGLIVPAPSGSTEGDCVGSLLEQNFDSLLFKLDTMSFKVTFDSSDTLNVSFSNLDTLNVSFSPFDTINVISHFDSLIFQRLDSIFNTLQKDTIFVTVTDTLNVSFSPFDTINVRSYFDSLIFQRLDSIFTTLQKDTIFVSITDTVRTLPVPPDVKKWNTKFERLDGKDVVFERCRQIATIAGNGATGDVTFHFHDNTSQTLPISLGIFPEWNPADDDGILANVRIDATNATNFFVNTIGCTEFPYECEPAPLLICGEIPDNPPIDSLCTGWTSASGTWASNGCCWASSGAGCGALTPCGALTYFGMSVPVSTPSNPNNAQTKITLMYNPFYISNPATQISVLFNNVLLTPSNTISYNYYPPNVIEIKTTLIQGLNVAVATATPNAPCPQEGLQSTVNF